MTTKRYKTKQRIDSEVSMISIEIYRFIDTKFNVAVSLDLLEQVSRYIHKRLPVVDEKENSLLKINYER